MILFSANTQTCYSVTPGGQYMERVSSPAGSIIRTTPNPLRFLGWITEGTAKQERRDEEITFKLMKCINWWELGGSEIVRGGFDLEHYKKVLKAKSNG